MRRILKQPIAHPGAFELRGRPVTIALDGNANPCVYFEDDGGLSGLYAVAVLFTGDTIPDGMTVVSTTRDPGGIVWHLATEVSS